MLRLRQAAELRPRIGHAGMLVLLACFTLPPHLAVPADGFPASPPLPVPRPRFEEPALNPPPVPKPPAAAPAVPAPTAVAPSTALPPNDPMVRLGELPRDQQRDILRRCAAEWDRMKRDGATRGLIWRDFLSSCLPDH